MNWTTDAPVKPGYYYAVENGSGVGGRERVVSLVYVCPISTVNEFYGLTWCGFGKTSFGRMSDVSQWCGPLGHPPLPDVREWNELDELVRLSKSKRQWAVVWR